MHHHGATGVSARRDLAIEEVADQRRHFIQLVFQGEMAGVENMHLRVGQVTLVGMRAGFGEDLVILAGNPLLVDPLQLENIAIVETFSRGESIYLQ